MGMVITLLTVSLLITLSEGVRQYDAGSENGNSERGNPGIKVRLSQAGFQHVKEVGVNILNREIPKVRISEYPTTVSTGLGEAKVILKNIQVTAYRPPEASVLILHPPDAVELTLINFNMGLTGNFHAQQGIFTADGTLNGLASGIAIATVLGMGWDGLVPNGHPVVELRKCDVYVTNTDFSVEADGLAGLFLKSNLAIINNGVKSALPGVLCKLIQGMLRGLTAYFVHNDRLLLPVHLITDNLNTESVLMNLISEAQKNLSLDLSFKRSAQVGGQFLETRHRGEMRYSDVQYVVPFFPSPVDDDPSPGNRMLYLTATDYVINSLLYNAYRRRRLAITLNKRSLSSKYRSILQTTCDIQKIDVESELSGLCVGSWVPELARHFPNQYINVLLEPDEAPQFQFTDQGKGNVTVKGRITVSTDVPEVPILFMKAVLQAEVEAVLRDQRLYGDLTVKDLQFEVRRTALTANAIKNVEDLAPIVQNLIETELRNVLQTGVDLPTPDLLQLTDPALRIRHGYIQIGTNFRINELRAQQLVAAALQKGVESFG